MRAILESIEGEYRRYRKLGENAIGQLSAEQLTRRLGENDNSVATIAWHIAGNLRSRFTDFLTTDGEKPWRDRESEFAPREVSHTELLEFWSGGWSALEGALTGIDDGKLGGTVTIRGNSPSIIEALHRSLAHTAYHVGQMVFLAKHLRGRDWKFASIPPGGSAEYNAHPVLDKPPVPPEEPSSS